MDDSVANESGSSDVIRDEPSTIFGVYEHLHDRVYFNCAHHLQQEQQLTRVCVLHCRTPLEHARDNQLPTCHIWMRRVHYAQALICVVSSGSREPSCAKCIRVLLRTAFSELSLSIGLAQGRWTIVIHRKGIVFIYSGVILWSLTAAIW